MNKSKKMLEDAESQAPDPVTFGDLITFKDADPTISGLLIGQLYSSHLGVQYYSTEQQREHLNYDDGVFRIVPQLVYRQRNEYAHRHTPHAPPVQPSSLNTSLFIIGWKPWSAPSSREAAHAPQADLPPSVRRACEQLRIHTTLRRSPHPGADEIVAAERLLYTRVANEDRANEKILKELMNGDHKSVVKYGMVIQLQHVKSGKFLSVREEAAPFDPECRSVSLEVRD